MEMKTSLIEGMDSGWKESGLDRPRMEHGMEEWNNGKEWMEGWKE